MECLEPDYFSPSERDMDHIEGMILDGEEVDGRDFLDSVLLPSLSQSEETEQALRLLVSGNQQYAEVLVSVISAALHEVAAEILQERERSDQAQARLNCLLVQRGYHL